MCQIAKGSNEAATFEWLKADDLAEDLKCGRHSDPYVSIRKVTILLKVLILKFSRTALSRHTLRVI